jgi:hypothetical protein
MCVGAGARTELHSRREKLGVSIGARDRKAGRGANVKINSAKQKVA